MMKVKHIGNFVWAVWINDDYENHRRVYGDFASVDEVKTFARDHGYFQPGDDISPAGPVS